MKTEPFTLFDLNVKDVLVLVNLPEKPINLYSESRNPVKRVVAEELQQGDHLLVLGFGIKDSTDGLWMKVLTPRTQGWFFLPNINLSFQRLVQDAVD
jgi:ABC-type Fe2+-enterobactin transport system substrate-binding protein